MSLGKPEIKQCHMEDDMALFATDQATNALAVMFHEQVSNQRNRANNHCFGCEQQVAQFMKNQFEKKFKSNWHCVVGRDFGAWVTHETGRFLFFYIGQKGFLIWATPS